MQKGYRKVRRKRLLSPENRSLSAVLAHIRSEHRLTQEQLGERLKRPQSYVWKIENGERGIDPVECAAWARACGITPRVFFNRFAETLERRP